MFLTLIGYAPIMLIAIMLIGLGRCGAMLFRDWERRQTAQTFLAKLDLLIAEEGRNRRTFEWLNRHARRIQRDMGRLGIVKYKPRGAKFLFSKYHLVINLVADVGKNRLNGHTHLVVKDANYVRDHVEQYAGGLNVELRRSIEGLMNPLTWLALGTGVFTTFPLRLLRKFGFKRNVEPITIERGPVARAINLVIALTFMGLTILQATVPVETALFAMAYLP
ncbi:MAG: hypothetical protein AAF556_05275 [Pseudomonadota bacterium]